MIYLFGSIILSAYLVLAIKYIDNKGVSTFEALTFNYCTCVVIGSLLNHSLPISVETLSQPWFICSIVMGTLFIFIFNLIGITVQKNGVSIASVANKLSLVIPFLFSLYLYHEHAGWIKWMGVAIALIAVYCTCFSTHNNTHKKPIVWIRYGLPIILFVCSGLLDTFIKYIEKHYLNDSNNNSFLVSTFFVAATIGFLGVLYKRIIKKHFFQWKTVVAGIAIGIPNYFSIWFLLQVLKKYTTHSSTIIPINNMGIVLVSTIVSTLLFREKLSIVNWIGVLLSIIAIACIAYG